KPDSAVPEPRGSGIQRRGALGSAHQRSPLAAVLPRCAGAFRGVSRVRSGLPAGRSRAAGGSVQPGNRTAGAFFTCLLVVVSPRGFFPSTGRYRGPELPPTRTGRKPLLGGEGFKNPRRVRIRTHFPGIGRCAGPLRSRSA